MADRLLPLQPALIALPGHMLEKDICLLFLLRRYRHHPKPVCPAALLAALQVLIADDGEGHGAGKVHEQVLHRVDEAYIEVACDMHDLARGACDGGIYDIVHTWMRVPVSVGSRATEDIEDTIVSFCMSMPRKESNENSTNSQSTPMVIEKQKATSAT